MPRLLRFAVGFFALFWVVAGQVSVLVFVYSVLEPQFQFIPPLDERILGAVLGLTTLATVLMGYYWAGGVVAAAAKVAGWVADDGADEPLVVGRVLANDLAWRMRYDDDETITVDRRECPRCGQELIERYLPRHRVLEPNTAFDPPTDAREAASKAWHDVTGKEKVEDRGETLALTCPDCNVSEPGQKDVMEGKDAAIARFRTHIENMQRPNSRRTPFDSYREMARSDSIGTPGPTDIWDAYVRSIDDESVLPVRGSVARAEDGSDSQTRTAR